MFFFSPLCAEAPPKTEEDCGLAALPPKMEPDPVVVPPKREGVVAVAEVLPPPKMEPELVVVLPKTEAVPGDALGVPAPKIEPEVVFGVPEMEDGVAVVAGVVEPTKQDFS